MKKKKGMEKLKVCWFSRFLDRTNVYIADGMTASSGK